ncbi:polysaccharide deacetylase family protein [Kitasatospora sp. NPDC054939]
MGLTRDGYRISLLDADGRALGPAEPYERCGVERPVARLAELADRAPGGLAVVIDSANGIADTPLTAAGLDVYRADRHLLTDGRITAEALAELGRTRLDALVPLGPGAWILAGREEEAFGAEAAAGPVERRLARRGRCLVGGAGTVPAVALTFDDGPDPVHTPQVLDVLRRHGVPAAFFCIGLHALAHPGLVRRIVDEGHTLGNHTWSHAYLPDLGPDGLRRQLVFTGEALAEAYGGAEPELMRPPFGGRSPQLLEQVAGFGLTTVLWDVETDDWSLPGAEVIAERVLQQVRPGSVVLMHDGGGDRSQTVAALPAVIRGLRERGYRFATLAELLAEQAESGRTGSERAGSGRAESGREPAAPAH